MAATSTHPRRRRNRGLRLTLFAVPAALLALLTAIYWHVTLPLLVAGATAAVLIGRRRWSRRRALRARGRAGLHAVDPHRLTPGQFEHYLADLCRRDGCSNVRVVGGANDLAADVLYTDPAGRRCLIQAKRYRTGNNVGSEHVQCVNGTYRDAHGCVQASIVTTSAFTPAAAAFAARVGIRLLDARGLALWASTGETAAPWR